MEIVDGILQYYTCPLECHAACCRFSPIRFERDEYYKILGNVDASARTLIEQKTVAMRLTHPFRAGTHGREIVQLVEKHEFFREFPSGVCPLLDGSDRCAIYQDRPAICRHYPFEFNIFNILGDFSENKFVIGACTLGIDIIFDYTCWLNLSHSTDAKIVNKALVKLYSEWVRCKGLRTAPTCGLIIAEPDNRLVLFLEYIKDNSPEIRKRRRDELLNSIKE